jgi:hypothetical protein
MRAWRAQRQAGIPLTPEQRATRRQLIRQWRETRRARWQAESGQTDGNLQAGNEAPDVADR